jgi:hypothetical protein
MVSTARKRAGSGRDEIAIAKLQARMNGSHPLGVRNNPTSPTNTRSPCPPNRTSYERRLLVSKVRNFAHVLRDQGISYEACISQVSYLFFLKIDDERVTLMEERSLLIEGSRWADLRNLAGEEPGSSTICGRTVGDFVLTSVREAAGRAIEEHQRLDLSVRDSKAFIDALLEPQPVTHGVLSQPSNRVPLPTTAANRS